MTQYEVSVIQALNSIANALNKIASNTSALLNGGSVGGYLEQIASALKHTKF